MKDTIAEIRINGKLYFFFLFFLLISFVNLQAENYTFKQIYLLEEKLQTNTVTSIIQDDFNFIWVGYDNGIARFDGYSIEPLSLNGNLAEISYVNNLYNIDHKLFICSNEGLYLYDYYTRKLQLASEELRKHNVIFVAPISDLWLVATNDGLFVFDSNWLMKDRISTKEGLSSNRITSVVIDDKNTIWVGTENGLDIVNLTDTKNQVKNILQACRIGQLFIDDNDFIWIRKNVDIFVGNGDRIINENEKALKCMANDTEATIFFSKKDEVWIGTRGSGILQYKISKKNDPVLVRKILVDENQKLDIKNTILSIYEDNYSNVWLGTLDGIYMNIAQKEESFHLIKSDPNNKNTPAHNIISSIYCDKNNALWLATADGVNKLIWENEKSYLFEHFRDNRDPANTIANNKIQTIIEYKEDIFLVSTKSSIKFFDSKSKHFFENKMLNDSLNKYEMKYVRSSYKDTDGNIWLAFSEGGVGVIDATDEKFHKLKLNTTNSKHRSIVRDQTGNLWVSSDDDGLYRLKLGEKITDIEEVKLYSRDFFMQHWLTALHVDKQNRVWVGTSNGLYYLDVKSDSFQLFEFIKSSKKLYVSGIIEDFHNHLWVLGVVGVYRISKNYEVQYYEPHYANNITKTWYITGLATNRDGVIFVGGVNGLISFNPSEIVPDSNPQTLHISNFSVLSKPVFPDGKYLEKDIDIAKKITLSHRDYQFSLTFSSLFYPDPSSVEYAYMLEGFDKDWVYTDASRRYVSYSNLTPGDYTFRVKSSTLSGIWLDNEEQVRITILPPPWKSWWAYLLYITGSFFIMFLIVKIFNLRSKLKYKEELNDWKLRNYINISYGFKVPLTLIYAPLQSLIKEYGTLSEYETKELLNTMLQSVRKLSFQISQLMEFRKIDYGQSKLCLDPTDIILLARGVFNTFQEEAVSRQINYRFSANVSSATATVDPSKIEISLHNLLSNAFSYTPEKGEITLSCDLNSSDYKLWISVSDTGRGIPPEYHKKIFDRFWQQGNNSENENNVHMGMGLSIASDYIKQHHSKVYVESQPGQGSVFKFYILLGDSHFKDKGGLGSSKDSFLSVNNFEPRVIFEPTTNGIKEKELPVIYFYEGDNELDYFIKSSLQKKYDVRIIVKQFDIQKFKENKPVLIIIDLSNDDNDKFDLCRKIKDDKFLSSIPVLFISSLSGEEDEQKAYELGADAYITKPFDIHYLKSRIDQLIKSRLQIKEKIKQELIVNPKEIAVTSDDDIFLANVMNILEENISNPQLNIDDLANKLNISRSMFYRKINGLTNQSPVEFIKKVRLKRAANLLEVTSLNINEISMMVGFSDQRYFSVCFKKEYGITPKSYSLKKRDSRTH